MKKIHHGTHGAYMNDNCRCAKCTKVNTDYYRNYKMTARYTEIDVQCNEPGCSDKASKLHKVKCRYHAEKALRLKYKLIHEPHRTPQAS